MKTEIKKASYINIGANFFLMALNLTIGLAFGALSLISKAIESIHDILTAIIIHITIKINNKKSDKCHQFGHTRAENIAGYTIGIIMVILSFAIIKESIEKIINPQPIIYSTILLYTVFIALIIKAILYLYIKNILKTNSSPALKANMQDHRNDILMYIGIFIAIIAIKYEYYLIDPIIGLTIGLIILKSGFEITKDNTNYLMGAAAPKNIIEKIHKTAIQIDNVLGINTIKTQYLGNKIQTEIHIELDENLNLKKSHDIGKKVKHAIKNLDTIEDCFVHIDIYKK